MWFPVWQKKCPIFFESLLISRIHIYPCATMSMYIYKPRYYIVSFCIIDFFCISILSKKRIFPLSEQSLLLEKLHFLYTFPFMIRILMFFLLSVVCYLSYQSSAATNSVIFRLMSGCDVRRDTGKSEVASPYAALRTTARCQFLKHPRRIFLACEISLIPMVIQ